MMKAKLNLHELGGWEHGSNVVVPRITDIRRDATRAQISGRVWQSCGECRKTLTMSESMPWKTNPPSRKRRE